MEIERHIAKSSLSLWHSLSAEQQDQLTGGESSMITAEMLQLHYTAPKPPRPGRARKPESDAKRHWASVAFEQYLRVYRADAKESIRPKRMQTEQRIRQKAWDWFAEVDDGARKEYLSEDFVFVKRVRKSRKKLQL